MAKPGAPKGNSNASKGKPWAEAIERALEIHKPAEKRLKLEALACSLVAKAMEGDMQALKEIGDRLDGKARQQVELSQDPENPVFRAIDADMPHDEATRVYKESLKSPSTH